MRSGSSEAKDPGVIPDVIHGRPVLGHVVAILVGRRATLDDVGEVRLDVGTFIEHARSIVVRAGSARVTSPAGARPRCLPAGGSSESRCRLP